MALSLFSDLGWVASELQDERQSNLGWSNGFALNYVLPIGPVGLVVAHQTIQPSYHVDYVQRPVVGRSRHDNWVESSDGRRPDPRARWAGRS